jgi:hypothetical protein
MDPVRDLEHVGHVVADENDRNALALDPLALLLERHRQKATKIIFASIVFFV